MYKRQEKCRAPWSPGESSPLAAYLMDSFLKELQPSQVKQDKHISYNEKGDDEHSRQWVKCVQRYGGMKSFNKYYFLCSRRRSFHVRKPKDECIKCGA